jgi:hypothetical protein
LRGVTNQPVERWALFPALGAANAVIFVDMDNLAAHPLGNPAQFALLIGGRLVERRNPEIEDGAFHGIPPFGVPVHWHGLVENPYFTGNRDCDFRGG